MIRKIAILTTLIMMSFTSFAQRNNVREVRMPQEGTTSSNIHDYQTFETGFFATAELSGGYSLNASRDNVGFSELSGVAGYRFSEFLRAGIGIGARYYIDAKDVRNMSHEWGLPLYLNLRGNFIAQEYRDVVPFWSMDLGTTFPDGAMVRPTIGIRVGQPRSAFTASVGYLGQKLRVFDGKDSFYSFVTLKIGYEF